MKPNHISFVPKEADRDPADAAFRMLYISVKTSLRIFSDEIHKQHLLNMIRDSAERSRYRVCVYALLDDNIQLLIMPDFLHVTRKKRDPLTLPGIYMMEVAERLMHAYMDYYLEVTDRYGEVPKVHCECEELSEVSDIMERMTRIHLAPVREGYVHLVQDYWFSSLVTYRGLYRWRMVDTAPILRLLSSDPDTARRKLLRLHRDALKKDGGSDEELTDDPVTYACEAEAADYVAEEMKGF